MTSKEMEVFQAVVKQVDELDAKIRKIKIKSNRRHRELRRLNSRMADLSIAKRLEEKFETFVQELLADFTFAESIASLSRASKRQTLNREQSSVSEPQPIATGNLSVVTESPETIIEPTEPLTAFSPERYIGNAKWKNPIDITRPAAHVKHTDGVCETCGYNPCRCSKEF